MNEPLNDLLHTTTTEEKELLFSFLNILREIRQRHKHNPPLKEIGKIIIKVKYNSAEPEGTLYLPQQPFKL